MVDRRAEIEPTEEQRVVDAMRVFVRDALALMRERAGSALVTLRPALPTSWRRIGGDEWFSTGPQPVIVPPLSIGDGSGPLGELPSYELLRNAFLAESWLARHVDAMVGTPSSRSRLQFSLLIDLFLLEPLVQAQPSLEFDEETFTSVARRLVGALLDREVTEVTLVPLTGFAGPSPISLGDEVVVRRLVDEELFRLLDLGLLPDRSVSGGARRVASSDQWAVCRVLRVPKVFDDTEPLPPPPAWHDLGQRADQFLTAVRLCVGGAVGRGPVVHLGPLDFPILGWGASHETAPLSRVEGDPAHPQPSDIASIKRVDQELGQVGPTPPRGLAVALRRFRDARLRRELDDVLVDLVVSAEALFLVDERGELPLRLATRAAMFTPVPGDTPGQVRRFMTKVYGARSALVHGGDKVKGLQALGGPAAELSRVVDDLELVMRHALQRAVALVAAGSQWPPDWDMMLDGVLEAQDLGQI